MFVRASEETFRKVVFDALGALEGKKEFSSGQTDLSAFCPAPPRPAAPPCTAPPRFARGIFGFRIRQGMQGMTGNNCITVQSCFGVGQSGCNFLGTKGIHDGADDDLRNKLDPESESFSPGNDKKQIPCLQRRRLGIGSCLTVEADKIIKCVNFILYGPMKEENLLTHLNDSFFPGISCMKRVYRDKQTSVHWSAMSNK